MDKYDLLLKANVTDDIDRLGKLLEFDRSVGGMKLYRYRPLDCNRLYELEALKECKIWGTNPDLFDDEYELCTSDYSSDDYKFIEYFVMRNARKHHHYQYQDLANLRKLSRSSVVKEAALLYKRKRREYAVSCFTENSPLSDEAMWHQYANDHGFCLEYSLASFIKAQVIIDPVYYIEKKSFGEIFRLLGECERAWLMVCIKNKYGVDKYSGSDDVINWELQREWRYLQYNEKEKNGKYKPGLYFRKSIKPDKVYVKGLDKEWIKKVELAAEANAIPVRIVNPGFARKIYECIKGY